MSDSAERRARRKLFAEAYNSLPSREVLQAAADLERAKTQRANQSEQMALQKGSLAVAVLSQIPREDENNKPLFNDARALLHEILNRGIAQLNDALDDEEDEEDDDEEAMARDGASRKS